MAAIVLVLAQAAAHAQSPALDTVKVTIGGRGTLESQVLESQVLENHVAEIGREQGIFKKNGLDLALRTAQNGDTLTAVTSGAADVGISVGTLATISAF